MFYTNKSIRLHNKCLAMLELIQKSTNRAEEQWANLRLYHNSKWDAPIRLMNRTDERIRQNIVRYETLSSWLVKRYQKAMKELGLENQRALSRMSITKSQPENA